MSRRTLMLVLAVVVLAAGVAVATLVTFREASPDDACPDRRWGCMEFEPDEPIVIGALIPSTARYRDDAQRLLAAAEETMEGAGDLFGHELTLDVQDDACSPAEASEAARRFGTSKSPTRPPTAAVIGGFCRATVQPAAQILSDTGVPFLPTFDGELVFAEPGPRLAFMVRAPAHADSTELALEAIRRVGIRLDDGTLLLPRTQLRDVLREHAGNLAAT